MSGDRCADCGRDGRAEPHTRGDPECSKDTITRLRAEAEALRREPLAKCSGIDWHLKMGDALAAGQYAVARLAVDGYFGPGAFARAAAALRSAPPGAP